MRTVALVLLVAACGPTTAVDDDVFSITIDTDWTYSGTVHTGEPREARISPAPQRRVYAFFAGATAQAPIDVELHLVSAEAPMRIALLAPLDGAGNRVVVASQGYTQPTQAPVLRAHLTQSGSYRIVVASFDRS